MLAVLDLRAEDLKIGMPVAVAVAGTRRPTGQGSRRMTTEEVLVCGAGITSFARTEASGRQLARAGRAGCLGDAGLPGPVRGRRTAAATWPAMLNTLVAELGLTGVPFVNVPTAARPAAAPWSRRSTRSVPGPADVALAVGFDKHPRGAFDPRPADWGLDEAYGRDGLMVTTQFFAMKIQRYMHDHGITARTLALVAEKAYASGARTPHAWRRTPARRDEILASGMVNDPLTRYMFCSPGQGAVALVLCSRAVARELDATPVTLRAAVVRTRRFGSFEVFSPWAPVGTPTSVSADAARLAFEEAGLGPSDIDVCQLQDTESGAEVMHLAECGFCEHGEQERLIRRRDRTRRCPAGQHRRRLHRQLAEPIGASGLRQVHEIVQQLRGRAGERQRPDRPSTGFTDVIGAGRQRLHRTDPLRPSSGRRTMSGIPEPEEFRAAARRWLTGVAAARADRREWGRGDDSVAVFENWSEAEEREHTDRIRDWERTRFDHGWARWTGHRSTGARTAADDEQLYRAEESRFDVPRRTEGLPGHPAAGGPGDPDLGHRGTAEALAATHAPHRRTRLPALLRDRSGSDLAAVRTRAVRQDDGWSRAVTRLDSAAPWSPPGEWPSAAATRTRPNTQASPSSWFGSTRRAWSCGPSGR